MELNSLPYILRRSARRRSIALVVDPAGTVRVSAPLFAPRFWIEKVIQKHRPWVTRQQIRMAEVRARHPVHQYLSGETFPVWGIPLTLEVQYQAPRKKACCTRIDGTLCVFLPTRSTRKIPAVKEVLSAWFWQETERQIAEQLDALALRMGVTYRTFKVVRQKSRWGSCWRQGHLRFNSTLSFFPPAALEYVMVHELAHLKEANHSPRFWAVVGAALPDYKERKVLLASAITKPLLNSV